MIADPKGRPWDISRAHQIRMTEPGWFDVAGGKLTTYRLMAQQTVNQIVRFAKIDARPCRTAEVPLLPDQAMPALSGILPPAVSREAVEHFCQSEWALHLDDVMIRRSSWRYYHPDHALIAERVAAWMGDSLGWDGARRRKEISTYTSSCR